MSRAEEIVKTVDGTEALRTNCRLIKGEYYIVGNPKIKGSGQCYQINGRYYRLSTGYIVYDELNQEYVLKNDSITTGIIGFDEKGGFIMGDFSRDNLKNVTLVDRAGMGYTVMDDSVMAGNREYRYDKSKDRYAHISIQDAVNFNRLRTVDYGYKQSLTYDCRDIIGRYISDYNRSNLQVNDYIKKNASALQGLTFGLEFETVRGVVPERITRSLGLIPLRDGSIDGLEYATIPLAGDKGLQAAIESCKALEKYTEFDESCSLHLHMGGVPRTEEYLISLFKVLCLIQDEFFEMFPIYKKYNFGVKRKNYTQPFDAISMMNQMDRVITSSNIKSNFDVLYRFLSRGQSYAEVGNDLDNVKGHPSDPRGTSKWNITSRYYWVNLIPIVFGNKQTVEFRIHTPTTDYNKTLNYIYICGAVLNYVKENQRSILAGTLPTKISLSDIIIKEYGKYGDNLIDSLLDYISERKQCVMADNHKGNIRGDENAIRTRYYDWNDEKGKKAKLKKASDYIGGFDPFDEVAIPNMEVDTESLTRLMERMRQATAPRPTRTGRVTADPIWFNMTDSSGS